MMIGPSARRGSRPGTRRADRSAPALSGPGSVRSSSGLDRSPPPPARPAPGPPRNVAPCPATAVASLPPACEASLASRFLACSSSPLQGRGTGVQPWRGRRRRSWGVFEGAGQDPSPDARRPVPIVPLLVHRTRAPVRASLPGGESSADLAGEERRSRWRARPICGRAQSRGQSSPPTQRRGEARTMSAGGRDSAGTPWDRRQRPSSATRAPDPPKERARLVRQPRGRLRRPRASHPWRTVSRRQHLHPYKGAERARTVSGDAGEKLGSF
jgi:hypothetical protein